MNFQETVEKKPQAFRGNICSLGKWKHDFRMGRDSEAIENGSEIVVLKGSQFPTSIVCYSMHLSRKRHGLHLE